MLTQEFLLEWFDYCADSGKLRWKKQKGRARAGDFAGTPGHHGYTQICINGIQRRLHQLIWIWHFGSIAEGLQVDHINGDCTDNHIQNLRIVDSRGNNTNTPIHRNGRLPGYIRRAGNRFEAKLVVRGKYAYLGTYATEKEAHQAYTDAVASLCYTD